MELLCEMNPDVTGDYIREDADSQMNKGLLPGSSASVVYTLLGKTMCGMMLNPRVDPRFPRGRSLETDPVAAIGVRPMIIHLRWSTNRCLRHPFISLNRLQSVDRSDETPTFRYRTHYNSQLHLVVEHKSKDAQYSVSPLSVSRS